jgi:hypothetical protein
MKSPFDVVAAIANPKLPLEPYPGATGVTGRVFGNTDTTYKFFWFLALRLGSRLNKQQSSQVFGTNFCEVTHSPLTPNHRERGQLNGSGDCPTESRARSLERP